MWIIPKTLSAFAPDTVASTWEYMTDLAEWASSAEQSLMWRSKPSQSETWSKRLKRVGWMRLLYGRTLKPSTQNRFVDWWTGLLEDTHVSHSARQDTEKESMTQDTCSRILFELSKQQDLFGVSSRTSAATSHLDSTRFTEAYTIWVTQLRQDYSARQKSAHRTADNDCSFTHIYPTITVDGNYNRKGLSKTSGDGLSTFINHYPTPASRDYKGANGEQHMDEKKRPHLGQLPNFVKYSPHLQDPDSSDGSHHVPSEDVFLTPTANQFARKDYEKRQKYRESIGRQYVPGSLQEQLDVNQNWRSPTASDGEGGIMEWRDGKSHKLKLRDHVVKWATPQAFDATGIVRSTPPDKSKGGHKNLREEVKGKLNPRWVETLMGLPVGWCLPSCTTLDDPANHTKINNRVDELRLLGNGVVPQVASKAIQQLWRNK